ncbi:MAG: hypothetical protein B6D59_02910 [Campylobacteraceae bacterium 4484_4]|nr:MAG: hypothetical protein B6D59_02910 [Campylobacteraceae bacterium 4484_4]
MKKRGKIYLLGIKKGIYPIDLYILEEFRIQFDLQFFGYLSIDLDQIFFAVVVKVEIQTGTFVPVGEQTLLEGFESGNIESVFGIEITDDQTVNDTDQNHHNHQFKKGKCVSSQNGNLKILYFASIIPHKPNFDIMLSYMKRSLCEGEDFSARR